eukprot:TRINITY_DN88295_c1_g1_i1.p2 TRINITY_DN88295_c1_g1~~TRINITY_DN88295_c1_g1_i1.p2  ORF type:complete len:229 (+),score=28.45 TRINITY_DN88295_c1_g1_i1:657-1343(+)
MIEELRDKKKQEERVKAEEKKQDLEKMRKYQELQEKKKAGGKNATTVADNPVYDVYGRVIEVQELNQFPLLANRCEPTFKRLNDEERQKKPKPKYLKKKLTRNEDDKNWETEFYKSGMHEHFEGNRMAHTLQKVYDNLIPVAGVTITEAGKNPKSSGISIGQKTGRFAKSELFFQGGDGTMRVSTSVPTLPNLPSQSISAYQLNLNSFKANNCTDKRANRRRSIGRTQ